MVVGPSGAKVVAVDAPFSNPYVDWTARASARDAMFQALAKGDEAGFRATSTQYGVTYVLWAAVDGPRLNLAALLGLEQVYENKRIRIFQVS
jgi:hypothetical protein